MYGCIPIVDHLEHAPADIPRALLSALRAVYMERGNGQKFIVVVAGALSLSNLTVGESSPFYGIARTVYVGDITEQESLVYITSFMTDRGVVVEDAIYDYLVHMAGGTIHLMNRICRECVESLPGSAREQLRLRDVQKTIKHFIRYAAAHYGPLREAVRLIEDDPDLLLYMSSFWNSRLSLDTGCHWD
ncbi:MAG: hypothetical protein GFH27_549287n67 [Chloroflexi bacterium AL-W]|nr:hypothetical protein [Chloroflexi bacterium AL-N1]NOK66341.1 hypothetical protein [Chloroflexi bacterium AL-N10]NOK71729.1 hypothetical protein [Chloroflexi bacterium AL-N5]NOK80986.1 hypothetical protein [Chloroflexi bacterium AL-W]NOK89259.1 hypothetical protein [Chloroflexi bacterium AL-N15]